MSTKTTKIVLGIVLADFAALTAWAVYTHGVIGLFELATANLATLTVFADLCIALTMVIIWMRNDARARGVSSLPYVILTLTLGSVGPLLYLILRDDRAPATTPRLAEHAARA
jgi:hypothetical protein